MSEPLLKERRKKIPGTPEDDIASAVITLLDEAHHLPASLIAELRKYNGSPDARPPKLAKQQNACRMLLDYAEELPQPLEAELTAYAEELAAISKYARSPARATVSTQSEGTRYGSEEQTRRRERRDRAGQYHCP